MLKWPAVTAMYDLTDLKTMMGVYRRMLTHQQPFLAVRPMHGLANRLRAYCAARAYAEQMGRALLVGRRRRAPEETLEGCVPACPSPHRPRHVSPHTLPHALTPCATRPHILPHALAAALRSRRQAASVRASERALAKAASRLSLGALGWQVHTQTAFTDLLERPEGVDVISTARAGLSAELWKRYNHMVPDRARRRNIVAADGVDTESRSLYVTTAYRLEFDPRRPKLYSRCLQSLRPVAFVRGLLLPTEPGVRHRLWWRRRRGDASPYELAQLGRRARANADGPGLGRTGDRRRHANRVQPGACTVASRRLVRLGATSLASCCPDRRWALAPLSARFGCSPATRSSRNA